MIIVLLVVVKIKKFRVLIIGIILAALMLLLEWEFYNFKIQQNNKQITKNLEEISCPDCNIVFISIDTLRADHISALGYSKKTTPNLDNFLNNSITFTNNISASSWTLPAHMTFMTGLLPSHHKMVNKFLLNNEKQTEEIADLSKVAPGIKTLAEYLKQNGYVTGGFTGGAGVDKGFGFNRGFDTYYDENNFGGFSDSAPRALDWIKQNKDKKMFIFLHGYDVHGQYVPKDGYDKRFVDFKYKGSLTGSTEEQQKMREDGVTNGQIYLTPDDVKFLIALYDEKIQRADKILGNFLDEYTSLGLNNKTIFVITSDHGDEFYEHGQIDHGHSLYDELIKTPLFIKTPKTITNLKIDKETSGADIMPTILSAVGIVAINKFDGIDLSQASEVYSRKEVVSETDYRYIVSQKSIRTEDGWKLIKDISSNLNELYNLNNDHLEKNNLINKLKEKEIFLSKELENILKI